MQPNGLYARGWRQGSIIQASLLVSVVVTGDDGAATSEARTCDAWIVASQDCDLDAASQDELEPTIELRMLHSQDPPTEWGIRSRTFLVAKDMFLVAEDPRLHVSPAALVSLEHARRGDLPEDARLVALKSWLGKRYDRPAVPDAWVPLARKVAKELGRKRFKSRLGEVREVLVQFEEGFPPRYSLAALVTDAADQADVRKWLAEASQEVPIELGLADEFIVGTSGQISLKFIEESYSASLSDITWAGGEPTGAH